MYLPYIDEEHSLFTHIYGANILVRLVTVNMKNCLTHKIRKCATQVK